VPTGIEWDASGDIMRGDTMEKNYYVILGVSTTATHEEIKSAFRRRALELHPDQSGLESGPFIEVQEAYGVLSDPERRRRYDETIARLTAPRRPAETFDDRAARRRRAAEPFRPAGSAGPIRDLSLTESFATFAPSFDELFDQLWSNFGLGTLARPKSQPFAPLTVEVVLRPAEAAVGGRVRVRIPGRTTCPTCRGRGALGPYECWRCAGHGALAAEFPVEVAYPPGLPDGCAKRVSLGRFGIENLYLTVRFRVSGEPE
jgi:molecular chaperone DnaJ